MHSAQNVSEKHRFENSECVLSGKSVVECWNDHCFLGLNALGLSAMLSLSHREKTTV